MINKDLQHYIEKNIYPIYSNNEKGHGIEHIEFVIKRTFEIIEAKGLNINKNIAYVVACYHDIGHYLDKDNHEKISAEMMIKDQNLKKYFDEEELVIIKEAIEDHRLSSKDKPRTIYGYVIRLADKNIDIDQFFKRAYYYSLKHFPNYTEEEHLERIYNHGQEKFGKKGYALLSFTDSKYENYLEEFQKLLANKELFQEKLEKIIKSEVIH